MTKQISSFIFLLSFSMFLFSACDIIEGPRVEGVVNEPGDTTVTKQKVLLEYYTGHTCGTCPPKAALIPGLKTAFGDQFIDISVHAGPLAEPSLNPDPNAKYKYDFRTDVGTDLYNYFSFSSVPNGLVNRTEYNGSVIHGGTAWGSAIQQLINNDPVAKMQINNNWNESTGVISSSVKTSFLREHTATVNLSVYLIEDGIVNWQKDYLLNPQDIPDYVHKNVLRASLNNTWGETIVNGTADEGSEYSKQYSFNTKTELDTSFNAANSYIVAFIFDDASKEILQVEKAKVIQ